MSREASGSSASRSSGARVTKAPGATSFADLLRGHRLAGCGVDHPLGDRHPVLSVEKAEVDRPILDPRVELDRHGGGTVALSQPDDALPDGARGHPQSL